MAKILGIRPARVGDAPALTVLALAELGRKYSHRILFLILLASFLLRVPGIPWSLKIFDRYGSPYGFHPDEFKIILGAKGFPKDIFVRTDLRYPTALHYQVGMIAMPLKLAEEDLPAETYDGLFVVIGRLLSTLFGVGAVALTYWLGKNTLDSLTGLIASALLAVALYHVRNSSIATTDVATSFWLLVVVLAADRAVKNINRADYVYLGLSFGMLVGTKYPGAFAAIPIGIILLRNLMGPSRDVRKTLAGLLYCAVFSILAFFLTTPSAFFHPGYVTQSVSYELTRTGILMPSIMDVFNLKDLLGVIGESTNPLFAALSVLGLLTSFRKTTVPALVPYATLVIVYLAFLNSSLIPRYVIFLMPLLCLLAAQLIGRLLTAPWKILRISGFSSLVLVMSISLLQDIAVIEMLHSDTRSRAGAYVAGHVPTAAHIKYLLVNSTRDECDFWIPDAEMSGWDLDRMPDILILEESASPLKGDVDRFASVSPVHYSLIKQFDPLWPVNVEYVSPTVRICGRGTANE